MLKTCMVTFLLDPTLQEELPSMTSYKNQEREGKETVCLQGIVKSQYH